MKIGKEGLDLIKSFEGCLLTAYLDIVGVPTIGYGCTEGVTKEDVQNKRTITKEEAEQMMMDELVQFEEGVTKYVTSKLSQNQFDALVSFSYNLGLAALHGSTLLKLLNSGDVSGAADQFPKWNHAGGNVVAGLTKRRLAEQALFNKSSDEQSTDLLPPVPTDDEIEVKLKGEE